MAEKKSSVSCHTGTSRRVMPVIAHLLNETNAYRLTRHTRDLVAALRSRGEPCLTLPRRSLSVVRAPKGAETVDDL